LSAQRSPVAVLIIGCDFHTRYQQIAMAEEATEELLFERPRVAHTRSVKTRLRGLSHSAARVYLSYPGRFYGTGMVGLPDAPSFHAFAKRADGTDGSRAVSLDI
jgi:hypothetical protein